MEYLLREKLERLVQSEIEARVARMHQVGTTYVGMRWNTLYSRAYVCGAWFVQSNTLCEYSYKKIGARSRGIFRRVEWDTIIAS